MRHRLPVADLREGTRRLERAAAHHLVHVLRLEPGDTFVAFDPVSGREADGVIVASDGAEMRVQLGRERSGAMPNGREIVWIQALAKADKCDAVVRDATELGATRIILAAAQRSVVRLEAGRAQARRARWERIAREAARQCGRSDAPTIDAPVPWLEALDGIPEFYARFCLYERAEEPLAPALFDELARNAPLAFACGPEGGLDPVEAAHARGQCWQLVSLGARILRTETVAAAVLGAVQVWGGLGL
ncbi:MAG: RsmE family RNA methyltransferase [Polyangiaceae bacterium]|jgi:16S rRNA (uracil1498-N3)-methyltransferase